ncbi:MAG: ATP-binding protein [Planctomycetota bacterium]
MSVVGLRALVLLASLAVAWGATRRFDDAGTILRSVLIGQVAFFVLGTLLAWRLIENPPVAVLVLAADILAVGAVGCWLHEGVHPQVAFLIGYTVAVLVAVVGGGFTAALLGTLAGAMTLGLAATLFANLRQEAPDLWLLGYQIVLLLAGSIETGIQIGWLRAGQSQRLFHARLEHAMRERESEAAELVTFAQALAASSGLSELAEAVVRHLRCHLTVRARAVALETKSDSVALWEENGRLGEDHVERRRSFLQDRMARLGNHLVIPKLQARSIGNRLLPQALDFRTLIEVPIRSAGRVGGVIVIADPRRGAVEERRIGLLADVARRVGEAMQRIERQGTEESRRTSLLLRQMREGVLLLAADGRVLLANPAAHKALGCPGTHMPLPPSIGEQSLEDLAQTPAGVSRRFRARIQPSPDEAPVQLACTAVGILDGHQRLGTLVTLSDITEEEMARHRLVQSEKLTLVGQTLAGVAHELNNPLTALIGYADLLKDHVDETRVGKTLAKIREQAIRATRIVKNLLSVARQRNPERTMTSLGDVAKTVIELFAYEARLSNVVLDVDIPDDLPEVLGDKHSLQQIFVNLIQNAIHALKEHDGERRIRVRMHALADTVIATLSDSGPGVPAGLRSRVFQPFFTTKGPNQGTGLGLALSRTVARDHGGDLLLDDDGHEGARFVLRLPRPRVAATPATVRQPAAGAPTISLKVLIVDDEKDVREALVAQLGRLGCEVDSTGNASEAMRMLSQGHYDALLVDIRMPGTSGIDLHRIVSEQNPEQAERMVFMTGDYANEAVIESVKSTGNDLLEKPFTLEELTRVLQNHTTTTSGNSKDHVKERRSAHDASAESAHGPARIVRL